MIRLPERFRAFFNNRWLVFVAAMWIQSCAGIGYLFGSLSPVIKSSLNYNQRQIARLGVAKDIGDSVGFWIGSLCEILPLWVALLIGALQNLIGYGWVWLIITHRVPTLPLWAICILIFVGTNGETYFNTVDLVSCVQNFPKSRGPVVGILKGFSGLSGAILTQIYTMIHSPDHASLLFMVAVGPTMVVFALMFIVRPVGGHRQVRPTDDLSFTFLYAVCLLLAAYLMGVMLLQDLVHLSHTVPKAPELEALLTEPQKEEPGKSEQDATEVIFSELEDEKPKEVDLLPASEKAKTNCPFASKTVPSSCRRSCEGQEEEGATIWNFLGRIGGGYFSEMIVRDYAYPRPVAMAVAQVTMALGHLFFAMGWPGSLYIGTLLIGLGYGAHWAIVPAAASELFGLKNFGALYNFINLANPTGSLVFSGVIASSIYDREAEKQAHHHHHQQQNMGSIFSGMLSVDDPPKCEGSICFFLTSMIMSGICIIAVVLSMVLVHRTKVVYANLYGKSRT
ncbi:Protein nuclear fusion defective 4 [Vitis vinifera]|uniref:Protein nuclear fusion defective 4 n=1 Tax=Vitis vinifera TaxID=29760 RepID=A0A438JCR5_VITVI|nr:Protein nuclear fusion defective 4 [Vitis vinifera]